MRARVFAICVAMLGGARTAHALDGGWNEPIKDTHEVAEEPSALGPDGTYGSFHDVRVRFGQGAGTWDADITSLFDTTSRTGTIREHTSVRLDSMYSRGLRPSGGWLWGIGGAIDSLDGSLSGPNASLRVATFDLIGGWALPIGSHAQLELLGLDQIGFGSMQDDFPGAPMRSLDGLQLGAAGESNLVITLGGGFQLAGSVGVRWSETHLGTNDGLYSAKITSRGWNAGVIVGKRF